MYLARTNRGERTKLEIIRVATSSFLEEGYSSTTVSKLCKILNISPGNFTFYFPTKDNLLAVLAELLCDFQWRLMEEEAQEGLSSVMAICLELATMASICDENEIARDFYVSAYKSPLCLDLIRKNDAHRTMEVFKAYCPDWTIEQFAEAELLVSGIEYATLTAVGGPVPMKARISGALNQILSIFNVPEEARSTKIEQVLAMDYPGIGRRMFQDFKTFVNETYVVQWTTKYCISEIRNVTKWKPQQ